MRRPALAIQPKVLYWDAEGGRVVVCVRCCDLWTLGRSPVVGAQQRAPRSNGRAVRGFPLPALDQGLTMPSYLSATELTAALTLRDLSDPEHGHHAMQIVLADVVTALTQLWDIPACQGWVRPVVRSKSI